MNKTNPLPESDRGFLVYPIMFSKTLYIWSDLG